MATYTFKDIYSLPIREVAQKLGLKTSGNAASCFNKLAHKNGDMHPSLVFYIHSFKCMACGVNGNSIELVKQVCNYDFKAAVKWLRESFDLSSNSVISHVYNNKIDNKDIQIFNDFISLCKMDNQHWKYLKERGFSELVREYGVTSTTPNIAQELKELHSIEDLIHSGIYSVGKNNKPYFTFFAHSLIFPFYYFDDVYFIQGRAIQDNAKFKYRNLPKEIQYPYNVNILTHSDVWGEDVFITEGCIDTLSMLEKSYNAIGIIGATNFKREWVKLFAEYEVNPIIALDNDAAGRKGSEILMEYFNKPLTKAELINGDWNDAIRDN